MISVTDKTNIMIKVKLKHAFSGRPARHVFLIQLFTRNS